MKEHFERWMGILFGLIFVALSLVVAVETVIRKVFNVSLQGADELGGYALAFGATIAFALALMGRAHIRVDVFHDRLPAVMQTALNWLSVVSLAAFALLMAWLARYVLTDSLEYGSVAQTPWATPLVYPQAAWLFGLVMFALVATVSALRATWLLLRGRVQTMNHDYGPRTTKEEVAEELEDLQARSAGQTATAGAAPAPVTTGARA